MTAQMSEVLHYEGQKLSMMGSPLDVHFALRGEWPSFRVPSTALWRGYVGTWEVRHGRLYLIGLRAQLKDGTTVTLETLFPGYPDRVFAHWFTGKLHVPQGPLIQFVNQGHQSRHEADLFLHVERGVLVFTELIKNMLQDERGEAAQRPARVEVL